MTVLVLRPELARHLALAVRRYRQTFRVNGVHPPVELEELEHSLMAVSDGPEGTPVAPGDDLAEPERVPLLYDYDEAARLLRVSPKTVARLVKSGDLHAISIGSSRRIPGDELTDFIDRKRSEKEPA